MKFGKVENADEIEFKLNEFTIISDKRKQGKGKTIFLGGTGWGNNEWKGFLYPSNARATDFLTYYQLQLNTIELNTTFYRIPTVPTVIKWRSQVSGDFKFCPKVPLMISRTKDLIQMQYYIDEFTSAIRNFDEHLGPCFIQWPEYSKLSDYKIFEAFTEFWPQDLELSMEFRNKECFAENSIHIDLLSLLLEKSIDCVITDVPGRRDAAHNTIINKNILIRFVSSGNFDTDFIRLIDWKRLIDSLPDHEEYKIYFFVHEGQNSKHAELTIFADKIFNMPNRIKIYQDNINTSGKNQTSLF